MTKVLVTGGGGFIAGHLVRRLLADGHEVRAADVKSKGDWWQWHAGAQNIDRCDLRQLDACSYGCIEVDEVYQLAADMGGAGFVFTGTNDAEIMHNSAQINLNFAELARVNQFRLFYSSSACIYPARNQLDPEAPDCRESTAYPADPDSEYGWEKLFSERLYDAYTRNHGTAVRIARFHNIYGPHGSWRDGREKAPAAICRKVAEAVRSGDHRIEIWGDGQQTRSFCWIDDCIRGIVAIMQGDDPRPVNLGSTEMVTINQLVDYAEAIAGIKLQRTYRLDAPTGVAGRNSDNAEFRRRYGWEPSTALRDGLENTYRWVEQQVRETI
jgi:nucleoside-diphosphate-sugar epimerase